MTSLLNIINYGSVLDIGALHIIILLLLEIGLNILINIIVLAQESWEE